MRWIAMPFRAIGWITGITKRRKAERKWLDHYGEIPDGMCLVYRNGQCLRPGSIRSFHLESAECKDVLQ